MILLYKYFFHKILQANFFIFKLLDKDRFVTEIFLDAAQYTPEIYRYAAVCQLNPDSQGVDPCFCMYPDPHAPTRAR
jgi:hypothetical protein